MGTAATGIGLCRLFEQCVCRDFHGYTYIIFFISFIGSNELKNSISSINGQLNYNHVIHYFCLHAGKYLYLFLNACFQDQETLVQSMKWHYTWMWAWRKRLRENAGCTIAQFSISSNGKLLNCCAGKLLHRGYSIQMETN